MRYFNDSYLGYWHPHTSTLDWCEENYAMCHYIAEFWNSLSNAAIFGSGLVGMYIHGSTRKTFLRWDRGMWTFFWLTIVGVGSTAFHMTLRTFGQLLDELPMVFGTAFMLSDRFEEYNRRMHGALDWVWALISILITIIYVYVQAPVFHQVSYGIMVGMVVVKAIVDYQQVKRRLTAMPTSGNQTDHAHHEGIDSFHAKALYLSTLKTLLLRGLLLYALAFALWNVDNELCHILRDARNYLEVLFESVSPVVGMLGAFFVTPFTQFHALWHVGTGFGTYQYLVYAILLKQRGAYEPRVKWLFFGLFPVPVPRRIGKLE